MPDPEPEGRNAVVERRPPSRSFVVNLWASIFAWLKRLSIFELVRWLIPRTRGSALFVDSWAVGNLLLAALSLAVSVPPDVRAWEVPLIIYGTVRVFEVVVYQVDLVLFAEYRTRKAGKPYALRGYRRLVLLLLHNYVEIILWFAVFYQNLPLATFQGTVRAAASPLNAFRLSFFTMTTFGTSDLAPKTSLGDFVVLWQAIIGVSAALLVFSRFLALLPASRTMDEFER